MHESPRTVTILIVDDHPANLRLLIETLKQSGWKTLVAINGDGAIRQSELARPDLILLDVMMPDMDGFETCRQMKQRESIKDIPVIFMTALADTVDKLKGFEVGGVDYITKPFQLMELLARVRVHLELKQAREEVIRINLELQSVNQQLLAYQRQLEQAARTDPLTGLPNRRDMMERLAEEYERVQRYHHPFAVALTDIDWFKKINDTFGHACGDAVLQEVARLLRGTIRKQDHVARWGGEEFLLLLPETDREGAMRMAERLRAVIARTALFYQDQPISITMTFGVYVIERAAMTLDVALTYADQALYQGKNQGRNCVRCFDEERMSTIEGTREKKI